MTKQGIIRIKLKSALSAGSGYSYAGIIDSDVCYDKYGLPYIPARRLKGCLRDIAENELGAILSHSSNELFGTGGQNKVVGLIVGDAVICGREEIVKQIKALQNKDREWRKYTEKQIILNKFTKVKAQTKMNDGVADDQTLRYTRMVNGFSPLTGRELEFLAKVSYDDALDGDLKNIVKGLRNIGVMRNRGLGSVTCELEETSETSDLSVVSLAHRGDMAEISYVLTNVQPLIISASRDDVSIKYIPGQNVLGMMAARYLSIEGNSAEDEMFKDIFLRGKAVFTNAVPVDKKHLYYPAPAFVNTLKKTKALVNAEKSDDPASNEEGSVYCTQNGNRPKKLRGKFVAIERTDGKLKFGTHDVGMKVVYHHDHRKQDDGNQGRLYMQTVIEEEQYFGGRIVIPYEYLNKQPEKDFDFISMLTMPAMYFGKSKTAQYGLCRLLSVTVSDYEPEEIQVNAGEELLVTLLSDGIFTDDNGYTTDHDKVVDCICRDLGLTKDEDSDIDQKSYSNIQTKKIYGYQTKWNLRKQPVPAIEAGSVYAIKVSKDTAISKEFVGERNLEGYGHVNVLAAYDIPYALSEISDIKEGSDVIRLDDGLRQLLIEIVVDDIRDIKMNKAINGDRFDNKASMNISASLRGRLTLMLVESIDRYPEEAQWNERRKDFKKRVDSIQSNDAKKVKKALKELLFDSEDLNAIDITKIAEEQQLNRLKNDLECDNKEIMDKVCNLWSEILMTILVNDKYIKGN